MAVRSLTEMVGGAVTVVSRRQRERDCPAVQRWENYWKKIGMRNNSHFGVNSARHTEKNITFILILECPIVKS